MRKKTVYDKLKEKLFEKKHVKELVAAFKESDNKHSFMMEHPSLFATAGVLNLAYFLPNGTINQAIYTLATSNIIIPNTGYYFTVPYKITFSITNITPDAVNAWIQIRDDDTGGGNEFTFGQSYTSPTTGQATAYTDIKAPGSSVVDYSFGTTTPANGVLITVQEQVLNNVQINVYDGAAYNTQSYVPITGVYTSNRRNITLLGSYINGAQYWDCVYQIKPTVAW